MWQPIGWRKDQQSLISFRRAHWLRVVARLAPGVSLEQASSQLRLVAEQLKAEYPVTNRIMEAELAPLHRFLVGDTRLPLFVLLAAVGLLLLIAAANVGNLQLVQAASRQRELAVRVALGAGRFRLMRQTFTENLLLAVIGGALGLMVGWFGAHLLMTLQPGDGSMLPVDYVVMDWRVAAFVAVISVTCGIGFGLDQERFRDDDTRFGLQFLATLRRIFDHAHIGKERVIADSLWCFEQHTLLDPGA